LVYLIVFLFFAPSRIFFSRIFLSRTFSRLVLTANHLTDADKKQTTENTELNHLNIWYTKHTKNPGFVDSYDTRPRNDMRLFWGRWKWRTWK